MQFFFILFLPGSLPGSIQNSWQVGGLWREKRIWPSVSKAFTYRCIAQCRQCWNFRREQAVCTQHSHAWLSLVASNGPRSDVFDSGTSWFAWWFGKGWKRCWRSPASLQETFGDDHQILGWKGWCTSFWWIIPFGKENCWSLVSIFCTNSSSMPCTEGGQRLGYGLQVIRADRAGDGSQMIQRTQNPQNPRRDSKAAKHQGQGYNKQNRTWLLYVLCITWYFAKTMTNDQSLYTS